MFNRLGDIAVLTKMVNRILLQAMANKMTGDWHDRLVKDERKAGNGRGNLQIDCGFSMTLRVGKTSVPGMNVPTRLRQYGRYDDIPSNGDGYKEEQDGDCTFETTMTNNVQDVTLVSDIISIKNGEEFTNYDVDRSKTWTTKVAEESGASTEYVRSGSASVFKLVVCQI